MKNKPSQVVYLFGSGATQAEASLHDETIKILARDIADGIYNKINKQNIKYLAEVKNDLAEPDVDVEQLITLFESSGNSKHKRIANGLKKIYKEEIEERLKKLDNPRQPQLLTALIDMYEINELGEELKGIITLNYEDLIEKAICKVKGCVDLLIDIRNVHRVYKLPQKKESTITLLKLHGSFNWKNEFPVKLVNKIKNAKDVLWIPPGVEKNKDQYPFSLIWGRATEILACDILRIVGCSLNRNDWQLIALLYATQRLHYTRNEYIIEIIDYQDVGEKLKKDYPHLRIRPILEISEVQEYVLNTYFPGRSSDRKLTEAMFEFMSRSNTTINIFDTWVKAKGEYLMNSLNIPIKTQKKYFENHVRGRYS
jgi:hypothetical protein